MQTLSKDTITININGCKSTVIQCFKFFVCLCYVSYVLRRSQYCIIHFNIFAKQARHKIVQNSGLGIIRVDKYNNEYYPLTGCFYVNVNWDCTYLNMSKNSRLWNTRSVDACYGVHLYLNSFYYLMQTRVCLTARQAIEANKYTILISFKYSKRSIWLPLHLDIFKLI